MMLRPSLTPFSKIIPDSLPYHAPRSHASIHTPYSAYHSEEVIVLYMLSYSPHETQGPYVLLLL